MVIGPTTDAGLHRAVGSASDCRSRGRKLVSQLSHIAFVEFNHEIISTLLTLTLPLIQEGSCQCVQIICKNSQR